MTAKLGDFGIAREGEGGHDRSDETNCDRTMRVVGTLNYMSPEYGTGGEVSARAQRVMATLGSRIRLHRK